MKNKLISIILMLVFISCENFLDVVPDNIATIENAFTMRNTAEKYLFTCYSYIPKNGDYIYDPAFMCADEVWGLQQSWAAPQIVRGFQNVVNPLFNPWSGLTASPALYMAIRDCNIFLENIPKVPDVEEYESDRWIAEVKFLKAYYHFYLMRMYGPIPIARDNLPISVSIEGAKVKRDHFDDCINYVVELLDEAVVNLPPRIEAEAIELGRITQPIALALKARVLIMAASPLFNGNADYLNFKNKDGSPLFSATYEAEKWKIAAEAAMAAINAAHESGHKLYFFKEYNPSGNSLSDQTNHKLNLRYAITSKWNPEIIWGNPNNLTNENQKQAQARLDGSTIGLASTGSTLAPTLKLAETFYTKNGVPIDEDITWDYAGRYTLKKATANDKYYVKEGYETVQLHFDRESRFYASLGFDGSIWYGQGKLTENDSWYVQAKLGQYSGRIQSGQYSQTGFWAKKLVNPDNVYSSTVNYSIVGYPFPEIRLADLYLLYAEAMNEYYGPSNEVYDYINLVRERAGLGSVQYSWELFSVNSKKYTTKEGLREIIHQERGIELAFEGQRYWDLMRWKKGITELNYIVQGWSITESNAVNYYKVNNLFKRTFKLKDYLWPIRELDLIVNKNLVQNPGW